PCRRAATCRGLRRTPERSSAVGLSASGQNGDHCVILSSLSRATWRPTTMAITVEAVYENGVLKPAQALPLAEHAQVRVTIEPAVTWVERTAGMMGFKGTAEEAE